MLVLREEVVLREHCQGLSLMDEQILEEYAPVSGPVRES